MIPEYFEMGASRLYQRVWLPEPTPHAMVLIIHGLAEHHARYDHVARYLNSEGYAVAAFDQRGHGRSDGRRAYIPDWEQCLDDLKAWHQQIRTYYPSIPFFLFSHSLGGLLAFHYIVDSKPKVRGAIFSAPALQVSDEVSPWLQKLAPIIGHLLPRLKTTRLNAHHISRDPKVVDRYLSDPLVYTGGIYAKTGAVVLHATAKVSAKVKDFNIPFLVMHGGDDMLTDPAGSKLLHRQAGSPDKTIKIYQDLYHELVNEPEKSEVLRDMVDWLHRRL